MLFPKAMKNEEKEEEKGNKWTLKDFQANLPEVFYMKSV